MDNKSFSLQFSPLTNVKCVKDYEEEIAQLKSENFGLKAQLTHSNLPKVLYENKQEMEAVLQQKQELQRSFEDLKRAYESQMQDKRLAASRYEQELASGNSKNGMLEDENKRLLHRLEKFNKEIQETNAIRDELNNLRMTVQNMEKQGEQTKYEYERYFAEMKDEYEKFKREAENEIRAKVFEIDSLKKKLELATQKEKNSSFIISDLKETLNAQMRDRSVLDEMRGVEATLRGEIEELQRQKQDSEFKLRASQETIEKIGKEHRIYIVGMDKFKLLIMQKLTGVSQSLVSLSERMNEFRKLCYISDENMSLLTKLKVKYRGINEVIGFFKEKHAEIYRKMDAMKKEMQLRPAKGGTDVRTQALLLEIKNQFGEARNELMVCKKYLEKKAGENKALRNENARLVAELQKKGGFVGDLGRANVMRI